MEQIELHRHLDVSIRTKTLLELAQQRGLVPESTSLESFRERILLRRPLKDLTEVLSKFSVFQKVLDRPEVLERVAFEAVLDCAAEGTHAVEFRFSPGFVCEKNSLSWEDALNGFEAGVLRGLRETPLKAGLICIASRDFGVDSVEQTVDFFLRHRSRFIGLDLAGNESEWPCRRFEAAFKRAREAGANITIHAGEAVGPENIWEAVELLGARRIGHGISAVKDYKLLEYLKKHEICLEMCPTSNWITQSVPSLEDHPLRRVLSEGVPVCISTDDPGIFGTTLPGEIQVCREKLGLSTGDVENCNAHARAASFLFAN